MLSLVHMRVIIWRKYTILSEISLIFNSSSFFLGYFHYGSCLDRRCVAQKVLPLKIELSAYCTYFCILQLHECVTLEFVALYWEIYKLEKFLLDFVLLWIKVRRKMFCIPCSDSSLFVPKVDFCLQLACLFKSPLNLFMQR